MKDIKKRFSALFLTALLAAGGAACGNTEETSAGSVSPASTQQQNAETEAAETGEQKYPGPETTDLEGYTLRVAVWNSLDKFIFTEEQRGEAVNDALYLADLGVMEQYNCKIEVVMDANFPDVTEAVYKSVQAGMDSYDLSHNHDCQTVANVLRGCFLDIRRFDRFDLDAPWWTNTKDSFTVDGQMYFASSYLTYSPIYLGMVLAYNKDLINDYGLTIPYDEIFSGNWYLDELITMTKDTNRDLNGDGQIILGEDQYGIIFNSLGMVNFQVSLGGAVLGKDADGYLELTIDENRLYNILEKTEHLMENGVDTINDGRWDYGTSYFSNGQGLFNYTQVNTIPSMMKDKDIHYGTIPCPKLDENQADYITGAFDLYWAIPITAESNIEKIATILEAKSRTCFYDVLPVSFETALQVRFSDSPDDAKTFEIIRDTSVVDLGYAFNEQNGGIADLIRVLSRMKTDTLSSSIEKARAKAQSGIDTINDIFRELAG